MTASRKPTPRRRCAAYVRISRDRPGESSTASQQAAIEALAASRGWDMVEVIVEKGESAFKASRTSRPGYRRLMSMVTAGVVDVVAVWKIDRLARSTIDLLRFIEDLDEAGVGFASVTESFDTSTPQGKVMLTLLAAIGEMESQGKSDRLTEWHRHRRLNGAAPAGPAALGYTKPEPNVLEPDPVTAPLITDVYRAVANGASINSQVKYLAAHGVKVSHNGLATSLKSPTALGMVAATVDAPERRGGARILDDVDLVPGAWEAIIDRPTWDTVRDILDAPDRRTNSTNQLRWPLVPVARCGACGSGMRYRTERWSTVDGPRSMGRLICTGDACKVGIGYTGLADAVDAALLAHLDNNVWDAMRSRSTGAPDTTATEDRLAKLWQGVLAGTIDPDQYLEAKTAWDGQLAAMTTDPADLPDVDDLAAAWPTMTPAEKVLVYRAAIERLEVAPATRRGGRGIDLDRITLDLV